MIPQKQVKTLLMSAFLTLFAPCAALSQSKTKPMGPIDGGGGNTIAGRSVESYATTVDKVRGYDLVVAPVLAKLKNSLPGYHQQILTTLKLSAFYEIPATLKVKLSSYVTGIPFDTDQTIINTKNEVWIDGYKMNRVKTELDAGILLLHEIVMLHLLNEQKTSQALIRLSGPDLHNTVRRLSQYLRLHTKESSQDLQSMVKELTGVEYTTKEQIAEYTAANPVFKQNYNAYRAGLKKETAELCAQLPTPYQVSRLGIPEQRNIYPVIKELSDLIVDRHTFYTYNNEIPFMLLYSNYSISLDRMRTDGLKQTLSKDLESYVGCSYSGCMSGIKDVWKYTRANDFNLMEGQSGNFWDGQLRKTYFGLTELCHSKTNLLAN